MTDTLKQKLYSGCYYLLLLFFATGIYTVNLICFVLTFLMPVKKAEWLLPKIVQSLFQIYIGLMLHSGMLHSNCDCLKRLRPDAGGRLIIANHPSLMDAPFFISRITGLVCVYKSSLKQSFTMGRTAKTLGYLSNESGIILLKEMAALLKTGKQVLLFPEGTRSSENSLEQMNSGYALAAMRAQVPVQLVRIREDSPILCKGWPLLKTVPFPVSFNFEFGPCIEPGSFRTTKTFNAFVKNWYRQNLNESSTLKQPFLPVAHTISSAKDASLKITFRVPENPFYCKGHMPGNPLVPAYAQMAWIREILRDHDTPAEEYFRWKFLKPILPGDAVEISIAPQARKRDICIFKESQRATQGKLLYPATDKGALS